MCSRSIQWLDSCSQKLHFSICSFELTLLNKQFQSRKILEEAPSPSIHPHHLSRLPRALSLHRDPETMERYYIVIWQLACLCGQSSSQDWELFSRYPVFGCLQVTSVCPSVWSNENPPQLEVSKGLSIQSWTQHTQSLPTRNHNLWDWSKAHSAKAQFRNSRLNSSNWTQKLYSPC